MNRRTPLRALAFAAALALPAAPALHADDWEARAIVNPDTLIRGVPVPSAFRGLDGKTQPPGLYDFRLRKGTQGILIALLKNGKSVAEFPGKFVPGRPDPDSKNAIGAVDPPEPDRKAGGDPPGGATKGHDISIRKAGGAQDIHFDASSRVSFGGAGGMGKISCSNNLHPGGANLGSISFLLPAVNVQGK